jgi:hypothetical protein
MRRDEEILGLIHADEELAGLVEDVCEFDVTRGDDWLLSGDEYEPVAGDATGGTFYLCGEARSVLYVSSEGQAGVLGGNLRKALEVMVGLPSWPDCLKFSDGGDPAVMLTAAEHLRRDELSDDPERATRRLEVAAALSLDLATMPELVARLRDAVAGTPPEWVTTDEGAYESLFGTIPPSRNPAWR